MPSEADYAVTDMAIGGESARHAGDNHLWVQFNMEPMADDAETAKEGRPIFREVEHIKIMQPGNKESIVIRPVTEMDKARFRQQYENWKAGNKEVLEGTPLEHWPRVTRAQVEELKFFNVRTVEQLANMSDANAQKFMGIATLRKLAREDVQRGKEGAMSSQMLEALQAKDNQIAALQDALAGLQQEVENLKTAPRRGRKAAEA